MTAVYIYLQTGGTLSSTGGACSRSPQLVVHVVSIGDLQWSPSKCTCMYMRGFKSCPRQLSLKMNMCTLGELCCVVLLCLSKSLRVVAMYILYILCSCPASAPHQVCDVKNVVSLTRPIL